LRPSLCRVSGVAVDSAGSVYATDPLAAQVLKLAACAGSPTILRFEGLKQPTDVAVDAAGDVFVSDLGANRVLALSVGGGNFVC
jgi:hypothetical protein